MKYTLFLYKVTMDKGSLLLKAIKCNDYDRGLNKIFKIINKKRFYYVGVKADNE